jgi:hypothetical protein
MTDPHPHEDVAHSALRVASAAVQSTWRAAPLALASGGVMMAAGYFLSTVGWGTAGLAMIPGAVLIVVAFRVARRRQSTTRHGMSEGLSLRAQLVVFGLTLASGGTMVFAGYICAAHSWMLAAGLAVAGGLVISGAFTVAVTRPFLPHV